MLQSDWDRPTLEGVGNWVENTHFPNSFKENHFEVRQTRPEVRAEGQTFQRRICWKVARSNLLPSDPRQPNFDSKFCYRTNSKKLAGWNYLSVRESSNDDWRLMALAVNLTPLKQFSSWKAPLLEQFSLRTSRWELLSGKVEKQLLSCEVHSEVHWEWTCQALKSSQVPKNSDSIRNPNSIELLEFELLD